MEDIKLLKASIDFFDSKNGSLHHAPFLVRIANAFLSDEKKTEKIMRELLYDPILYDEIQKKILPYFAIEKPISGFKILWDQFRGKLVKFQFQDPVNFDIILDAILNKSFIFTYEEGVKKGNIFNEIKIHFQFESKAIDELLIAIYSLNTQIGKNPSGKGEYLLDLFVKNAYKSSDVNIDENEYEIKSTNAAVGESLGSKITYIETISSIFEQSGCKFNYETFSFGKKFSTVWSPIFINMTKQSPASAYELIKYQYEFYMQNNMNDKFIKIVDNFLLNPDNTSLCAIYDELCRQYIIKSLNGKIMLVFYEVGVGEKRVPTGDYVCFNEKSVTEAVSFSGSETSTATKIFLPKSSATMRPEIQYVP